MGSTASTPEMTQLNVSHEKRRREQNVEEGIQQKEFHKIAEKEVDSFIQEKEEECIKYFKNYYIENGRFPRIQDTRSSACSKTTDLSCDVLTAMQRRTGKYVNYHYNHYPDRDSTHCVMYLDPLVKGNKFGFQQ